MKRHFVVIALTAATVGVATLLLPAVEAHTPSSGADAVRSQAGGQSSGVTISPSTLSFGFFQIGMASPGQNVAITNNGSSSVTIFTVTVSANFTRTNNCPGVLKAGASCIVKVNFIPKTADKLTGSLTITASDPGSPHIVNMSGTGLGVGSLGGPLGGLDSQENMLFQNGFTIFNIKWDPFKGLGPVFTQAGCFTCHGGGVSFPDGIPGNTSANLGTRFGKLNSDGTFNPLDGTGTFPENEGGPILHPMTVAGIPRIQHCNVTGEVLPKDATVVNKIRSPQLFGFGLIDSIPESTILAGQGPKGMGINGVANMVPDQNGVLHAGRFGQKSSVPSLLLFTASAMFNELGITSPIFPNEHIPSGDQVIDPGCETDPNDPQDPESVNAVAIYQFQAMLAPAPTQSLSGAAQAGKVVFENIGCNLCHTEAMQTDSGATVFTNMNGGNIGTVASLANQTVSLYSDLLLHDMGPGLSGGIPQGQASLTQWRTAPLWGLTSRRNFGLLHDARTTDVDAAIRAHGGEASQVIGMYTTLSPKDHRETYSASLARSERDNRAVIQKRPRSCTVRDLGIFLSSKDRVQSTDFRSGFLLHGRWCKVLHLDSGGDGGQTS